MNAPTMSGSQAKMIPPSREIDVGVFFQYPHWFIPDFESCELVKLANGGFLRPAKIRRGPLLMEHVFVEPYERAVLFLEQEVRTPDGASFPGRFAALNRVVERSDGYCFEGTYHYDGGLGVEGETAKKAMFDATHKNMMDFARTVHVHEVPLQSY